MNKLFFFFFILFTTNLSAQDTVYFRMRSRPVKTLQEAKYYEVTSYNSKDSNQYQMKRYTVTGKLEYEYNYIDFKKKIYTTKIWKNDTLFHVSYNIDNKSKDTTYWANGKIKSTYENDNFTNISKQKCFNLKGQLEECKTFKLDEKMPEFPGGEKELFKFLSREVKYPKSCRKKGTERKVQVSFIITKQGKFEDFLIVKSVHPDIDNEAIRVLKLMPNWIPAMQNGNTVEVVYYLPINFYL
jgi:TonB family protein